MLISLARRPVRPRGPSAKRELTDESPEINPRALSSRRAPLRAARQAAAPKWPTFSNGAGGLLLQKGCSGKTSHTWVRQRERERETGERMKETAQQKGLILPCTHTHKQTQESNSPTFAKLKSLQKRLRSWLLLAFFRLQRCQLFPSSHDPVGRV